MTFPDQPHMNHVSDALWRIGGGASVMVGSGFSRNARPRRPDPSPMPTLKEMAREFHRMLHPCGGNQEDCPPPERVPRLAEEYEAAFGPIALHEMLRRMVPDRDYVPGPFHERLLRMPWCDIFTTNWDTLLERARAVPAYAAVRAPSDLPSSTRPRIVKLHGSLPNPPLILTEETYRTYRRNYAPFVNTVQQAMMETVVLLLGFSGDDPNFLHWSGWVRDNLGAAAPKIYLAGHLRLSRTQRRMLQARNVVSIDLAEHPKAGEWPEHLWHRLATDWILTSLECDRPYDQTRWPNPPEKPKEVDSRLEPVAALRPLAGPVAEPAIVTPQSTSTEADGAKVAQAVEAWRHNRECYPGWIVFPRDIRSGLRATIERWAPFILDVLPSMKLLERLDVIYEMIWRLEKSLARMPEALETAASEVLVAIDCRARTVGGERVATADWTAIRAKWRDVALSLLTAARYRLDADGFEAGLERLKEYTDDDPCVGERFHHERCLWSLWELDYESLEERLGEWNVGDVDPMWKVRKSALLRDIGKGSEADSLVEEAVAEIGTVPQSGREIVAVSREGWALRSTMSLDNFARIHERLRQLAPLKCDARDVWDLRSDLEHSDRDGQPAPHFDLGVQRTSRQSIRSANDMRTRAYTSVRLAEVAGLPVAVDLMDVAGSLLALSADRLAKDDPRIAVSLVLRATKVENAPALERVLSRERVAALPKDEARQLCHAAQRLALHAIRGIEKTRRRRKNIPWLERARVAMEGWSRLVLRRDGEAASETFRCALELYRDPVVESDFWLHDALGNLLRRSWKTMPQRYRARWILDILETPIPNDAEDGAISRYPEPGDLLGDVQRPPDRTPESEPRWTNVVETLVRAADGSGEVRERASRRLGRIAAWGLLTEAEAMQAAAAWWGAEADENTPVPPQTTLHDYAFIVLPEPRPGMGRGAFARKWLAGDASQIALTKLYRHGTVGLTAPEQNPRRADDILYQAGRAVAFMRHRERSLELSQSEQAFLTDVVDRWTGTGVQWVRDFPDMVYAPFRTSMTNAVAGLGWLLSHMQVSVSLAEKLNRKAKVLHDTRLPDKGIPAFAILPGILRSAPELLDDIALTMAVGLASADGGMARGAFHALHLWLRWEPDETLPSPPERLVREVGVATAARRLSATGEALSIAQWIFEQGRADHREIIRDLVLSGMGYLVEELRYDREIATADVLDIPLARWRCIQVARAIAVEQSKTPEVVRRWLELGRDDPLPEVRHVAANWGKEGGITK